MKVLIVFLCCVGVALSAVAIAPASGKYCEYKNKKLEVGEKYVPEGECMQIVCNGQNGEASYANYFSCGAVRNSNPNLVIVRNPKLRYPNCCPTIKSKDEVSKDDIVQK